MDGMICRGEFLTATLVTRVLNFESKQSERFPRIEEVRLLTVAITSVIKSDIATRISIILNPLRFDGVVVFALVIGPPNSFGSLDLLPDDMLGEE